MKSPGRGSQALPTVRPPGCRTQWAALRRHRQGFKAGARVWVWEVHPGEPRGTSLAKSLPATSQLCPLGSPALAKLVKVPLRSFPEAAMRGSVARSVRPEGGTVVSS